uniref:Uncharacterized protein n=1 Tax=Cacopsylla melanoneura TaxID=428564 RepID=A0A8D8TCB0_9HEMI
MIDVHAFPLICDFKLSHPVKLSINSCTGKNQKDQINLQYVVIKKIYMTDSINYHSLPHLLFQNKNLRKNIKQTLVLRLVEEEEERRKKKGERRIRRRKKKKETILLLSCHG